MSEHSKRGGMVLHYKNDLPNGRAPTGTIVDRADGLVAAEVYGTTPGACDALGRKMAAALELVDALVALVRKVGRLGSDDYYENPLHKDDMERARAARKKAGVKP